MCALPLPIPIKIPDVHLHMHLEMENCCRDCCKDTCNRWTVCSDNTRIVAIDNQTLVPEKKSCISRLFCCCCYHSDAEELHEQNSLTARTFEIYLQQQYGPISSSLGLKMAKLDLKTMQENGLPLLANAVRESIQRCEEAQQRLEALKSMVKSVKYYSDLESSKKTKEEELSPSKEKTRKEEIKLSHSMEECEVEEIKLSRSVEERGMEEDKLSHSMEESEGKEVAKKEKKRHRKKEKVEHELPAVVIKRNGEREDFQEEKIRQGLINAPTTTPLSPEQISSILSEIKGHLIRMRAHSISSDVIHRITLDQMKQQGVSLRRPEILDAIEDMEIRDKLQSLQQLEDLSLDELISLLQITQKRI